MILPDNLGEALRAQNIGQRPRRLRLKEGIHQGWYMGVGRGARNGASVNPGDAQGPVVAAGAGWLLCLDASPASAKDGVIKRNGTRRRRFPQCKTATL